MAVQTDGQTDRQLEARQPCHTRRHTISDFFNILVNSLKNILVNDNGIIKIGVVFLVVLRGYWPREIPRQISLNNVSFVSHTDMLSDYQTKDVGFGCSLERVLYLAGRGESTYRQDIL